MAIRLTQNQRNLIDLLGGYKEMSTHQLEYFMLHINSKSLAAPFTGLDKANYTGDGYYVVSLDRRGLLRILSIRLNGNTVNGLINRQVITPYKYRYTYQVAL